MHRLLFLLLFVSIGCRPWAPPLDDDDDDSVASADDDDSASADDDDATDAPVADLLTCEASIPQLIVPWGVPTASPLVSTLYWPDGSTTQPPDVLYTLSGEVGGAVVSGAYQATGDRGGIATVEARVGELVASCQIVVNLVVDLDDTEIEGLADAVGPALATPTAGCGPTWLYPPDGAAFPGNWPPIDWQLMPTASVSVLRLETAFVTVTLTTTGNRGQTPAGVQTALFESGGVLLATAYGADWDGVALTNVCRGESRSVTPQPERLDGHVTFWSPATEGLWRIPAGSTEAEAFLGPPETGYCVGCHSVNLANPNRMAMNYGGGDQWAVVRTVTEEAGSEVMPPLVNTGNFMTLSPDGSRMVGSYQGALRLFDVDTGTLMQTLTTTGHATHPDWSPDGSRLVYSSCGSANNDWTAYDCSIRWQSYVADSFAGDTLLVEAPAGNNFYYPSYSPDSQWVSFNRTAGSSNNAADADLRLVHADGGTPRVLTVAGLDPPAANSWPRWAVSSGGDRAWLAFSSRRDYGYDNTNGVAQVWLTSIDLTATGVEDPSTPGIWLPGQDPAVGNHTPVWIPRYARAPQ